MNFLEFYDGGAYPQYHFAQYPCGLGLHDSLPQSIRDAIERSRCENKTSKEQFTENRLLTNYNSISKKVINDNSTNINDGKTATSHMSLAIVTNPSCESANSSESLDAHTARTQEVLEKALKEQRRSEEDFSGRHITRPSSKGSMKEQNALTIVVPHNKEGIESHGAIVRSPIKAKQMAFAVTNDLISAHSANSSSESQLGTNNFNSHSSDLASEKVVVPFSVSSWRNKKKLIIPVEERLAQQADERRSSTSHGIGDSVLELAMAMQNASREVKEEMETKERIRAEELERQQAEREAAEAARAKQLLEESAARLRMSHQRHETREERLARVKLERELRERERAERRRQALLQRAASRLNISVDALEADEVLLRTVEESATHAESNITRNPTKGSSLDDASWSTLPYGITSSSSPLTDTLNNNSNQNEQELTASLNTLDSYKHSNNKSGNSEFSIKGNNEANNWANYSLKNDDNNVDNDDDTNENQSWRRGRRVKGGIFAQAVISNEGIKAEMEALAELERAQGQLASNGGPVHDGIHWTDKESEVSMFAHEGRRQDHNNSASDHFNHGHDTHSNVSMSKSSEVSEYTDDGIARLMKRKRTRL